MNSLAFAEVDNFEAIVSQSADKQSVVRCIQRKMIDSSLHSRQRDYLLQLKRCVFLRRNGGNSYPARQRRGYPVPISLQNVVIFECPC